MKPRSACGARRGDGTRGGHRGHVAGVPRRSLCCRRGERPPSRALGDSGGSAAGLTVAFPWEQPTSRHSPGEEWRLDPRPGPRLAPRAERAPLRHPPALRGRPSPGKAQRGSALAAPPAPQRCSRGSPSRPRRAGCGARLLARWAGVSTPGDEPRGQQGPRLPAAKNVCGAKRLDKRTCDGSGGSSPGVFAIKRSLESTDTCFSIGGGKHGV